MTITKQHSKNLMEASNKFKNTKYEASIKEASQAYLNEDYNLMETILSKLPTEPILLASLLEKLKGKSVEKGLKKVLQEGRATTLEQGISTASLLVHILIECKEDSTYKLLLPDAYKKLGEFINL